MTPTLYSERQIGLIRESGKILAECLELIGKAAKPGITTKHLDAIARELMEKRGGKPAFLEYQYGNMPPFPASICASVNDVVIHGIPDETPLSEGDLLSIDIGIRKDYYFADCAWTFGIGEVNENGKKLLKVGEDSLNAALAAIKNREPLTAIGKAVQTMAESNGFSVIKEFVGHGIGHKLHEFPQIRNYVGEEKEDLLKLKTGMVIAVEPMLNEKSAMVKFGSNTWPVMTADGGRAVHFEHTVTVTDNGCEILTRL